MAAKILVVDDEPDLQALIQRRFRREIRNGEFAFAFANDGLEALELVREDPHIDLVLSDINMPRMDGLTLLERLMEFEERLKTIVVSAYGDMDNLRTAMNRGAFDFVTKPIDFGDLLITIKKSLGQLALLKNAIRQRAEADRARANLARYFPPKLAATLAQRDQPFGSPREQSVAVLFADIRGFTTLSESLPPNTVMEMLRDFHGRVEAAIFDNGGILQNYIGDAVLATFGVPDTGPTDASNALVAARTMLDDLNHWNQERTARNEPPIGIGIGLHYGPVVLGDVGSERSMAFTIIGDTVNTASRLQGLTRNLDSDLVVSETLIDHARREYDGNEDRLLQELAAAGAQELRGRSGRLSVFVLDRADTNVRSCSGHG
ncbi:MAG: adenylate/guanylate cyclase domain-containing protein [Pseudomonadota bacterium]